ncbi:MAG: phage integrase SAM-like domain-containing protein, partial [Desulfurococcales archaeon]|nr:phage integrase SAM-like domain-containing protein [Desulfurococcales archaeon]
MCEPDMIERFVSRYSSSTRETYRSALVNLIKFSGQGLDQLVEKARANPSEIEDLLNDFKMWLRRQGKSNKTINTYLLAIKSFLKYRRVTGINVRLEQDSVKTLDYIPTPEEVNMLINRVPLRMKVAIVLIAHAGIRPVDVVNMRYMNIRDEIEFKDGRYRAAKIPLKITLKQQKTGQWYVTFLTNV